MDRVDIMIRDIHDSTSNRLGQFVNKHGMGAEDGSSWQYRRHMELYRKEV